MKRSYVLFLILFALASSLNAQGRSLLSFIETEGQIFAVQTEGDLLYFTDYQEPFTYFTRADVSDPGQPVILDSLRVEALVADFDLKDEYAYLMLSDGLQGVGVVSIADRDSLGPLKYFSSAESVGSYIDGDTLFVADGGGLSVYDISSPDTLLLAWSFNSGDGNEVFATGELVFLSATDEGLHILDRKNRDLAGTVMSPDISIGLAANPAYAFFSDNTHGLIAVDITDAQNPVPVDTAAADDSFAGGITTSGVLGYFCNGSNGIRIFDVSSPAAGLVEHTPFTTDGLFALRVVRRNPVLFVASADLDNSGAFRNGVALVTEGATSVDEPPTGIPESFALQQNYPNPFNPVTQITYQVAATSEVRLEVFNLLGHRIRTLVDVRQEAGVHTVQWNGTNDSGKQVAAGAYFYRLSLNAGLWVTTRKMILLK